MSRVAIIGDVHGHASELIVMLGDLEAHGVDRVILLGDLVDRGPASIRALRTAATWSFRARSGETRYYEIVKGNHEDAYVRIYQGVAKPGRDRVEQPEDRSLYRGFTKSDLDLMAALPTYIEVPELNLVVLHGGVTPHMESLEHGGDYTLRVRYLDDHYYELRGTRSSETFWADVYDGRFGTIVFGHESHRRPTHYEHAIAIDGEGFRKLHAIVVSDEAGDERVQGFTVAYGAKRSWDVAMATDPQRAHSFDYPSRSHGLRHQTSLF